MMLRRNNTCASPRRRQSRQRRSRGYPRANREELTLGVTLRAQKGGRQGLVRIMVTKVCTLLVCRLLEKQLAFAAKKKRTKRDVFLAEMAAVVPWAALVAVLEPHYPKAGPLGGRRPFPLPVMLRIYCLQQWYNLSDPGAEEALYDIQSMRAFAGLELGRDTIPDETTILNFRHLLERHDLTKAVFAAVAEHLEARGALLRGGTIVDATLIAASPSTKNEAQKRDPEMRSSKKGNQWYFGMKAHIGVDAKSGLVHTAGVTTCAPF